MDTAMQKLTLQEISYKLSYKEIVEPGERDFKFTFSKNDEQLGELHITRTTRGLFPFELKIGDDTIAKGTVALSRDNFEFMAQADFQKLPIHFLKRLFRDGPVNVELIAKKMERYDDRFISKITCLH